MVWQLNWGRLGRALCAALGLDCRPSTLPLENTCQIGSWSTESVPVILTIQTQPERFRAVLAELGNRLRRRFILLAPTPDLLDAVGQELLANAGAGFFALTTHVHFTAHGGLQPVRTPGELFAAFTPQPAAALEEDTARRAFALAEQLGANALKVFRLYCIEGLSAAQAARLARCSRSAFYRRLELIRARTGMEPAQLRKLSPQLAQIEADLADSRASRIQRTRLIYDGEEEGE